MLAAKDIKRKKAVIVIVSMIESSCLTSMNRVIGGIKTQNEFFRRFIKRFNKNLNQRVADLYIVYCLFCASAGPEALRDRSF